MITSISQAGYLRPAQAQPSKTTLTPADALPVPDADVNKTADNAKQGIPVSEVRRLDTSKLKAISIADHPELRDRMATMWLNTQAAEARMATEVPDNAPQNIYATVKVNGKVVATLYNGGSSAMTNAAAGAVGDLQDPPGLTAAPIWRKRAQNGSPRRWAARSRRRRRQLHNRNGRRVPIFRRTIPARNWTMPGRR